VFKGLPAGVKSSYSQKVHSKALGLHVAREPRKNKLRFGNLRCAVVASWVNTFIETNAAGQRQPEMLALMTQVWVREDDGWKVLHSHESTRPTSGDR
jgi:hypothetical protein